MDVLCRKDISATPAVANGVVYFPSWNGYIDAVTASRGSLIWQQNLDQLTGLNGTGVVVNVTVSRSTPTVANDLIIFGIYGPALVLALNRWTGKLVCALYIGVSSLEEGLPAEQCCTFRGRMTKLDVKTGFVLWNTYMIPAMEAEGEGIQELQYGEAALQLMKHKTTRAAKPDKPDQCIAPEMHYDSILALEMDTGKMRWARQLGGYDVFYFACLVPNNPDCPPGPNPDADFGEAPMLLSSFINETVRDIVVAVQKSGFARALDRDDGRIVWFKEAGPGGDEGGGQWGAATDGRRVYTNIANSGRESFNLAPSNQTTTSGAWVALDARSGEILWSTANPSNDTAQGPVSVVNDILLAGSVASNGPIYAMHTKTGKILWSYNTGATVYGGISASYGCIFLRNGYTVGLAKFHTTWTPGTSLYAFCLS
ncbi:Polyvinylalcohol dehydrogenase [Linum perenne]